MMLIEKISKDIVTAMKAKDVIALSQMRAIKTALDTYRVNQQKPITESIEQSILQTIAKQRIEAATAFRNAGRDESALAEELELEIIERYMFKLATEDQIHTALGCAIITLGIRLTKPDPFRKRIMGQVIKEVKDTLPGKRIDGKALAAKVQKLLA